MSDCGYCGYPEPDCRCDDPVDEDADCSWCCGEGMFFGSELPGYDPGWHLPDEMYPCPACGGTGARHSQVLF